MPTPSYQRRHTGDTLAGDGDAVTPSNTVPIEICSGLYVNDPGGDVAVQWRSGRISIFKNYVGFLPVSVQYVRQTGTTATDIIALY